MEARKKAWKLLCDVCVEGTYANLALRHDLKDVVPQDKALITSLVYGTLQHWDHLQYEWSDLIERKIPKQLEVILNMSVYQLFYMDKMPVYAVVNEAVNIAKGVYSGRYAKLVNALLHKVIKREQRVLPDDPLKKMALQASLPLWLVSMWNAQYGEEVCAKLCDDVLKIAKTWVRYDMRYGDVETFLREHPDFEASGLADDCLIYHGHSLVESEAFLNGVITIQDASSQMVAHILDPKSGDRILDACAAPGSKSCHIASLMQDSGEIIALDLHEHRVKLIEEGVKRCHLTCIKAMVMDALKANETWESKSFDKVLIDAPCSGYGVLKGKSDIKYRMQSSDMDTLIPLQRNILDSCFDLVKEDGILVYSTCTLNKKENEKQVESFLQRHPDFELEQERSVFPYTYNSDGFYIARLRRLKEA